MPIGLEPLDHSLQSPFKLSHLISQPQLFASLPNSQDCWCWAMGLHPPKWISPTLPLLPIVGQSAPILVSQPQSSPNLGQSAPIQPQSHVPLAWGPVHCPCALPGCAARVRCLGAACVRGLGLARVLCLCALPVRAAWALPGRCACA